MALLILGPVSASSQHIYMLSHFPEPHEMSQTRGTLFVGRPREGLADIALVGPTAVELTASRSFRTAVRLVCLRLLGLTFGRN